MECTVPEVNETTKTILTDSYVKKIMHQGEGAKFVRTSFHGSDLTALRITINTSPIEISKTMIPGHQDMNMRFFKIPDQTLSSVRVIRTTH
jgi:hypothetical protein